MNTWIWGPPKWRFLHTLSFSPGVAAPANASKVAQFLECLQHVLPCIYCRESYGGFYAELVARFGPTPDVAVSKQLPLWMYTLHDKVNHKLDLQTTQEALTKAGAEVSTSPDAICRKRQLTFECLKKRFYVRPVQYMSDDLWDVLLIFMLNLDDTRAETKPVPARRMEGYRCFFDLLPTMVQLSAGATPEAVHLTTTIQAMCEHWDVVLARQGKNPLFKWVLRFKALHDNTPYTRQYEADMLKQYGLARAGVCMHGSCQ